MAKREHGIPADVADLKADNFYLNLHSVDNPAGYARGQLLFPAPETVIQTFDQQVCRTIQAPQTQTQVAPPARPVVTTSARGASAGGIAPPTAGDAGLLFGSTESGQLLFAVVILAASTTVLATMRRRS